MRADDEARLAALGLIIVKDCPRCTGKLYKKRSCGGLKMSGFRWVLKCPTAGCGHMEGYKENE